MIPAGFPISITAPCLVQSQPFHRSYQYPTFNEVVTFTQEKEIKNSKIVKMIGWYPPPQGWVKVNTDGASKSSIDLASAGGLVRDSSGRWCAGFSMNLGGPAMWLEAEFMGIWGGLDLAWKMGFRNVILESDCKVAIDFLGNCDSDDHIIRSIKELLSREWNVIFQFHYREGNQSADWLANLGIELSTGYHEFLHPPSGIFKQLNEDYIGVTYPRLCKAQYN